MSSLSTFGAFTTARLGIYSSSKWLDVIGNNISNINTEGYTRQAVDQISLHMGGADKYRTGLDVRVGNGGLVTGVTQLRDPYLDIRYRTELSNVGSKETKLNGLGQIASVLDEVAYGEDADGNLGNLELQFNDLLSQVSNLVNQGADEDAFDTNVRTSASAMAQIFNSYASRLEKLRGNMEKELKQDVTKVNELLTNIRDLSDSIRKSNIYGGDALEQKDERNNLIDELAEYIRIDVKYEMEKLGGGLEVEKLVISLDGDDMDDPTYNKMVLVDGIYCAQLSIDHEKKSNDPNKPYLDADGNPTAAKEKAAREFNEYYQVKVGTLRDRWSRTEDVPYEVQDKVAKEYSVADPADAATIRGDAQAEADRLNALDADDPARYAVIGGKAYQFKYNVKEITKPDPADKDKTIVTGYEVVRTASFAPFALNDNTLYGRLQSKRELLTEQGEYATEEQLAVDRNANTKRGVIYYQKVLDTLANQFANVMNGANQYGATLDKDKIRELAQVPGTDPQEYDLSRVQISVNDTIDKQKFQTVEIDGDSYFVPNGQCDLFATDAARDIVTGLDADPDMTQEELLELIHTKYGGTEQEALESFKKEAEKAKVSKNGLLTEEQKEHLLPDIPELGTLGHAKMVPEDEARAVKTGILFSNHGSGDDPTGITAANISISKAWGEGAVRIVQSTDPNHPSTAQENLYHIQHLLDGTKHDFTPLAYDLDGTPHFDDEPMPEHPVSTSVMFSGTFQEMFTDYICGHLAADSNDTSVVLNNYMTAADELYVDRDAVSGVDLNDETMNMMQVQKSLTAAYRLMTVIDDMLDRLINGTGRAGL